MLDRFAEQVKDPEWNLILLNASEPVEPRDTWVRATNQWLTGAYIITQQGARWILQNFKQKYEADLHTWKLQDEGHAYTCFPWVCIQECNESTTGTDVVENKRKIERLLEDELFKYS